MATFDKGAIRVFDRAGKPLGTLTRWNVEQSRGFRLNEIEDFKFSLPRNDGVTGTQILTSTVVNTLLRRDNLVYLQNSDILMRGWGGVIRSVKYANGQAFVECIGLMSLFHKLDTLLIEQDDGDVWTIAKRMVTAANAKQGAHGDLVVEFLHDETGTNRRNYGHFAYEGDVLAGLQGLASRTLSEMFIHARLRPDGRLRAALRWGGRYVIDKTAIVIKDGVGGNIMPGNDITFTSDGFVNRARLRGQPTDLSRWVDYSSVRNVIKDVVPECELILDPTASTTQRRREELDLSVSFGYPTETEKSLARTVQERYLGYYKAFLYAYHNRLGKPFLEGYDWSGPNGRNDKQLTAHYFRSYRRLAYIGTRTVLVGDTEDSSEESNIEATFTDWSFYKTITPVGTAAGIATDFEDPDQKFVGDADTGYVWVLQSDFVTKTLWGKVTATGETLKGLGTDPTVPSVLWVMVTTGSAMTVKSYDSDTKILLSSWTVAGAQASTDMSVQAQDGIIWTVQTTSANVYPRDINSGAVLTTGTYTQFSSGFSSPRGLHVTGGIAYVTDASGNIRFLFTTDGALAGTKSTGLPASGIFTDVTGGMVWVIRSADGNINLYRAHVAVGIVEAPGQAEGAPGFEDISLGQFVSVVMNSDKAQVPHSRTKLIVVYSPGKYVTKTVPTNPGEPDQIQRTWVTGEQKVATLQNTAVHYTHAEQVIRGEESRVDDWNPKQDGYGVFSKAVYRTKRGHVLSFGYQWFFHDWDIPDSAFEVDPPEWTEGLAYLQEYLARANQERTVQVLRVNNRGNLFRKLVLGGKYTVQVTLQGPPGGFSGVLRVLAYTPDDSQGICEIIGEWV